MQGRFTRLGPVTPRFTEELFELAATNQIPWQWRHNPETPDGFRESLWRGVLVQYAVQELRTGRDVALVRADNANLFHGHAYLTMMLHPAFRMRGWPMEGAGLFGDYLFTKFNLLQLYAETPASVFAQFRSGAGRAFEIEARFRDRVLVNGRREDLYVLTFARDRWLEARAEADSSREEADEPGQASTASSGDEGHLVASGRRE
jgi:hypothetical protein